MFGLLKKIFKKDAGESSPAVPPPVAPTYARTATPSQPGRPAGNPFSNSLPPAVPAMNAAATVRTPAAPAQGNLPDVLSLPLGTVVAGLSPEFQNLFIPNLPPNLEVQFALQGILPQLSSGRVRVAFGQLRQACPNGSCKAGPDHDAKLIELPLANILSRINPALLPRKTQRQIMDVPKDVTGLFGSIGESVASPAPMAAAQTPATPPARPQPPATAAKRRSSVPEDLENIPSPFTFPKSAPQPAADPIPEPVAPPIPPAATPKRRSSVPAGLENIPSPFAFQAAAAAPQPPVEEPAIADASQPVAFQPAPEIAQEEIPKIKFDPGVAFGKAKSAPQPTAPVAPPARPIVASPAPLPPAKLQEVKDENYLIVTLSEVAEGWPEAVIGEVQQFGLADEQLSLPVGEIDLAMRKGKIVFKWKTIRTWMGNAAASATSPNDDLELLLPLKVVAPKFLALRQPKGKQRKTHIEESIPDLFSGGPAPAPVAPPTAAPVPAAKAPIANPLVAPEPAAHAPAPAPIAAPPKAPARKPAVTISAANPNELVAKTAQLAGVTGALLAMNDGLVVASQLPKPLQGETVAAFLPQIFGRLTHFATELKLGDLSSVMLIMDNSPWIIFRTGKVYFAVVGNPGEALPLPQLMAIVADIKRQNL